MIAAEGILTARGGSSHAALVARQMGMRVCGAADLDIDYKSAQSKLMVQHTKKVNTYPLMELLEKSLQES